MTEKYPHGYFNNHPIEWWLDRVKGYSSRAEFARQDRKLYYAAYHRGLLDTLCQGMKQISEKEKFDHIVDGKYVVYEGTSQILGTRYVGATKDLTNRIWCHRGLNNKATERYRQDVRDLFNSSDLVVTKLTEPLSVEEAEKMEEFFISKFDGDEDYRLLNIRSRYMRKRRAKVTRS